jgi:uncharacterized integral membrane protein
MELETNRAIDSPSENRPNSEEQPSKIGRVWVSLIIFVVVLLLLAIFILQNSEKVKISYFGFHGSLSFGVGMLLSALVGAVLTLLIGSIRIIQLKGQRKKRLPAHS